MKLQKRANGGSEGADGIDLHLAGHVGGILLMHPKRQEASLGKNVIVVVHN